MLAVSEEGEECELKKQKPQVSLYYHQILTSELAYIYVYTHTLTL